MEKYLLIVQEIVQNIKIEDTILPFNEIGIDSIDLVTIRVEFEREIGKSIPDAKWLSFNKLYDVFEYCSDSDQLFLEEKAKLNSIIKKNVIIDMPQMAISALSENWLFKEWGNLHWQMLCDGLNTKSYELKDDLNNRLYATFVRIKIQSNVPFTQYKENSTLKIEGKINRFGNSMYFSNIVLKTGASHINADLMTSFSIRNDLDNTKLVKSQPSCKENSIGEFKSIPKFGDEYRLLKKNELDEIKVDSILFRIKNDFVFEDFYKINPYYDLNGVGLLYFASYPVISDVCESNFFNNRENNQKRWELTYYTKSREIFYYANCNIDDEIIYRLHSFSFIDDHTVILNCSLYRRIDNVLMARIFTIKVKE